MQIAAGRFRPVDHWRPPYSLYGITKTVSFASWIYISVHCKRDFGVYHIQDTVLQKVFGNSRVVSLPPPYENASRAELAR